MVVRIRAAHVFTALFLIVLFITAVSAAVFRQTAAFVAVKESESAVVASEPEVQRQATDGPDDTEESFSPRLSAPEGDNACYYSGDNIFYAAGYGMPNCTCYAWGRAYELIGEKPELSPYDACTWYDYNAENGIYDYGDTPTEGAIACWAYDDGGSGHVAVVEEIDGDDLILSNSAYSGAEFYIESVPADDPSNGREGWIFQGYIYPEAV